MPPSNSLITRTWDRLKSPAGAAVLAIIGLISGLAIGIYGLVAERQPSLQFTVLSMSRVFDVHQSVGGLEVSYAGQDLRAAKKTLWSIAVMVANPGSAGIRRSDFDDRLPVSLTVTNGAIVDKPTMSGAANYLLKTFTFKQDPSSLIFDPFILDPQDGIRISLLILGQEGTQPTLTVSGKIAGIRTIELILPESPEASQSLWRRITGADTWWIHLPRAIVYALGLLLLIVILTLLLLGLTAPFQYFSERQSIRQRGERLKGYEYKPKAGRETANARLLALYESQGRSVLVRLLRIKKTLLARRQLIASLSGTGLSHEELQLIARRRFPSFPGDRSTYQGIKEASLVEEDASGTKLTEGLDEALTSLSSFLSIDMTKATLVLEEYWKQEDVRMIPIELLEHERLHADA